MVDTAVVDEDGGTSWRRPMRARDHDEEHRAASPLELLFDLCFVVAVAQAAAGLHHAVVAGQVAEGVLGYGLVFFAIWWAWVNFTWFASAFDNDDVLYRLVTLVQIAGVLLLAAGVPAAFEQRYSWAVTAGYVVMRVALVIQWLRVAHDDPGARKMALRYAAGVSVLLFGWVGLGFAPGLALPGFAVLATLELLVPVVALRAGPPTPWHPGHVAERYGLFTLIVLGESVLAATSTVGSAVTTGGLSASLIVSAAGGLVLIFALWWSYFERPAAEGLRLAPGRVFGWGYGHLLVFACLAAVGAGLQVVTETVGHHTALSARGAALALAVPVALYLAIMGPLHTFINRHRGERVVGRFTVTALLVVLAAGAAPPLPLPVAVAIIGLLVAGLIAVDLLWPARLRH
jgi:low temperature requirement protein LtrA